MDHKFFQVGLENAGPPDEFIAMIGFIFCCVGLAFLVQNGNPYLALLETPVALAIGLTLMGVALLAGYLKKLPTIVWHDGFASAGLLVWYAYWKPQFNDDAPMFFFFPVYFATLTTLVTLSLINRAERFDLDSIEHLRYLEKITRFNFGSVIGFVIVGLLVTRHYALYPMSMTFYIVRHTMVVCLESVEKA
ncbi:hypothetical protein ACQE3E_09335 [Methylomonas sp. MED-D]|uniref:hypothetical protein n=1 Tax=unclassified Methylomonas TaxID=2608980 RepID=UPI0028A43D8A|nr:hypothetical protein [Methylomonas sp. MV1]MDT4328886.1 hypothetical protein [Methylomonas sp. MV1]